MVRAVGLSVGATTVAAVTAESAVVRTPVLTYYDRSPPTLGQPGENPADPSARTITDFVDRVGDPVGILASDGSSHRGERVLADALHTLIGLSGRRPDVAAVTYPAHWRPQAADALRRCLPSIQLIPDVAAAVTALQRDPGLPTRGVLAVCDFGGSGTSITLVDAADGYRPIGPTIRHTDFSGDLVDQALLTRVIGGLADAGAVDLASTSAIGALSMLRQACRGAKERLSRSTVTAVPVDVPGHRSEVRLTRTELDDLVRPPLQGVPATIEEMLQRNGIRPNALSAVATVGGGAAMVAVTTTLSETLRVPVITSSRPALTAATGAALRVLRGPADDSATALAPASMTATMAAAAMAAPEPESAALAWSQADDIPDVVPADASGWTGARPQVDFIDDPHSPHPDPVAWYRKPLLAAAAVSAVLLAAAGGIGVALTGDSTETSAVQTPATQISSPAAGQPSAPAPEPLAAAQDPQPAPIRTVTAVPAPVTQTQVVRPPAAAGPPPSSAPPPSTTQPTTTQPTTTQPTTTQPTTTRPTTTQPATTQPTTTQPTTPPPSTTQPTTPPPSTSQPPPATTPPPATETAPPPQPTPPATEPEPSVDNSVPDEPIWTIPPIPGLPLLPATS